MTHAGSSKMSIEDMIGHYQRSIEKSENDPKRLLHCLAKLCRMNVTVQHLQATGIGRTVNQLRKDDGEVGVAAKALVSKWKEMVAAEESSECSEDDEEESVDDPDETSGNETERSPTEKMVEKAVYERRDSNSSESQRIQSDGSGHHHHQNSHHHKHRHQHDPSIKSNVEDGSRKHSSQQHHNGRHSHHSNTQDREASHARRHHSNDVTPTSLSRSNRKHSDESAGVNGNYEHDGTSNDDVLSENEPLDKASSAYSHSERNHKSKHHHGHGSGQPSSRVDKVEREHHTKYSSHKSSSSSNNNRESGHMVKPSGSKSDRNHRDASKRDTERKHGDRSKSTSSTSNHKRKIESDAITSHGESSSQENGEMNASKRRKSDTNTSSSASASSRHEHKKSSKSSKHAPATDSFEIDQSMGTSFADALGMIVPTTSKGSGGNAPPSTKSSSKNVERSIHSSSKHRSSSGTGGGSAKGSSKSSSSSSNGTKKADDTILPPPLLSPKAELPPLEDISVDLPVPAITNNYKPLPLNPLVMECIFKPQSSGSCASASTLKPVRLMTVEEALGGRMSTKKELRKVFSGGKKDAKQTALSLYDLCLRAIQKDISKLEYVAHVPFYILRPVLETATPEQLANIEHFNPQLMDESDVLWQHHCARRFRSKQREEMETWRDMYFRCQAEQEERLNNLTNNIKMSQSVAVPVKQTKLAYIDSMVKPPRSVAKKQTQFGTERKLIATPAARTAALSSVAANIARAGDIRLRTTAAMRDPAQLQPSASGLKTRKAPLMVKSLQLMKGRFKR